MKKVTEFDVFARNLKDVTLSQWSAWRYVIDNKSKKLTFIETKETLKKKPKSKYIIAYFKGVYWGNVKFR